MSSVAFIGFGEAAQAFTGDQAWKGRACAFDKLTDVPSTAAAKWQDYRGCGVLGTSNLADAVAESGLVLSLVTADQALLVARDAALSVTNGAFYCDMNSVAPGTKWEAADAIESAGASYVDVAIMAPVRPGRLSVPLLISGTGAEAAAQRLEELGFSNVRAIGDRVGQASAIKMIRSVIIKGIEALTAEAMLAAEAAGVTKEVLASLDASDRQTQWQARADYNLERMLVHGTRRSEEMLEVAKTLRELGVDPRMTGGAAEWQAEIGRLQIEPIADELGGKIAQIKGKAGGQ